MAEGWRPVISNQTAKAVIKVLEAGIVTAELSDEENALVIQFMRKISTWEEMSSVLARLSKKLPKLDEQDERRESAVKNLASETEARSFSDLTDEELEHFIIANEGKAEMESHIRQVQSEIAKRTRERESQPKRIRPPEPSE